MGCIGNRKDEHGGTFNYMKELSRCTKNESDIARRFKDFVGIQNTNTLKGGCSKGAFRVARLLAR